MKRQTPIDEQADQNSTAEGIVTSPAEFKQILESTERMDAADAVAEPLKPEPALIYVGPNLPRGILNQFTVYTGGLPRHLEQHFEKRPAIKRLFVSVDALAEVQQAISQPGTAEQVWFQDIKDYIQGGAK